ncbi:MAG: Bro-N domain-containing protein [Prevotella sp.]|nr:Bro-N domain-containing protein [Prevotella sp.]
MTKTNAIKMFEDRLVRSVWDDEKEEWYFSVNDVVEILTDSTNVTDYIKKMRKRDEALSEGWGQIVTPLAVQTAGGKQKTNFANAKGLFRIIQSIPSKKSEPFKLWLAEVGAHRLEQMQDPELSIKQALQDYRRLGYSDNWINQRLKSIEIRKDLTDQWKEHHVSEGVQYAALTDIIYQTWAGKTAKEYKQFKGLKKENLRDNMTNEELVLNMLAELSATSITKAKNPQSLEENAQCAHEGGIVAAVARKELESKTGKSVVSPLNAREFFTRQIEQNDNNGLALPLANDDENK